MAPAGVVCVLDRWIRRVLSLGRFLALPVAILLFLQWPLRDFVRAYSREANDLGQWMFALYVAMAVTAATRAKTHLATDVVASRYSDRVRRALVRFGALAGLVPWAIFVIVTSKSIVAASLFGLEAFPDTANPGYFVIKLALWVMAGLVLAQSIVDVFKAYGEQRT
jgi:TRAP-type mannitol/chloroaromatic compound transport system permease small subunit